MVASVRVGGSARAVFVALTERSWPTATEMGVGVRVAGFSLHLFFCAAPPQVDIDEERGGGEDEEERQSVTSSSDSRRISLGKGGCAAA